MDNKFDGKEKLLIKKDILHTHIEYLEHKIKKINEGDIKEILIRDRDKFLTELEELKIIFERNNFKLSFVNSYQVFDEVNSQIDCINDSTELFEWIKENSSKEYLDYIVRIENPTGNFNEFVTGKWQGSFKSNNEFASGEFSIGVCQIGNKVIGYGAFINSIYTKVFIKGLVDGDEVKIELLTEYEETKTFFEGKLESLEPTTHIVGNYYIVDGLDHGTIDSFIVKEIKIPLSRKTTSLIKLAGHKKMIANGDSTSLIQILTDIGEFFPMHLNESIIHKNRMNKLIKNKRINVLSYSEAQLEESRIINDILELISQIENNL